MISDMPAGSVDCWMNGQFGLRVCGWASVGQSLPDGHINPMGALLIPVVIRLFVKSKKVMDFDTFGLYVGLYFALMVIANFGASHLQGQVLSGGATISNEVLFAFRECIVLTFFARLVLGFV